MAKGIKNTNKKLRIALIQMSMDYDVWSKNIEKATSMIKGAAKNGAKIICLPELFNTLYFPQEENNRDAKRYAETIPGKTTKLLCSLAKNLKVVILAPIYEITKENKFYNTAAVISEEGKILGTYRKMHIPHDPLFYEKDYFDEGNTGFKVIKTTYGNIAPLICFDQWFPEAARNVALKGADIIFYPTAIGWIKDSKEKDDSLDAWITIQRSHAIANNVHVASVNRVGIEGNLNFWGSSFISDPFGKVLAKGSDNKEEIIFADLDIEDNARLRQSWGFFVKRRPKDYKLITEDLMDVKKDSPRKLGYYFPAEWEEHEAILLAWPHNKISFPNTVKAEKAYVKIVSSLEGSEEIRLIIKDSSMKKRISEILKKNKVSISRIRFLEHDNGDVWFRDFGPTYIVNKNEKKLGMVKWKYNAYGNKYDDLMIDDSIPLFLNKFTNLPYFKADMVMEGGSIETNGEGTILTTEECLLNKNRNPGLNKNDIENTLKEFLGATDIIWLKNGLVNDDTDGHIDNLARFVNKNTILCCYEENTKDVNYKALKKNYDLLCNSEDSKGRKFSVVKLPVPKFYSGRKRLAASYANFYIANNAVLVPQFNVPEDKKVLGIISKYFPKRKIVGIDCSYLILGGGTIHCISQQVPRI